MFKCGICHELSQPGEKAVHVVIKTRKKQYPYRVNAHDNGKDDPGGIGTEIVREVLAHKGCRLQ